MRFEKIEPKDGRNVIYMDASTFLLFDFFIFNRRSRIRYIHYNPPIIFSQLNQISSADITSSRGKEENEANIFITLFFFTNVRNR